MRRRARPSALLLRLIRRRAVRALRAGAAPLGQLRGGAGLPGAVHAAIRSSATACKPGAPHALHDRRVRHRDRDQRRRASATTKTIGPKPADERAHRACSAIRWCCPCRCRSQQTFCRAARATAERAAAGATPLPRHQRRRAGLRAGRGAAVLQARSRATFAARPRDRDGIRRQRRRGGGHVRSRGCAGAARPVTERCPGRRSSTRLRRLVRRSMVLQVLRLRVVAADRPLPQQRRHRPSRRSRATPANPAPRIAEGLAHRRANASHGHRGRRRGGGSPDDGHADAGALPGRRRRLRPAARGRRAGRRRSSCATRATERFDDGAGAAAAAAVRPAAGAARRAARPRPLLPADRPPDAARPRDRRRARSSAFIRGQRLLVH